MLNLYSDPCFTFHFAEDRIIPRFHLEGVLPGSHVSVIKIDPASGERLGLLATATVGDGGWVDLDAPIIVRAGDAFVTVPSLIRPERAADQEAIRQVSRLAFGQDAEARLVDALRSGGFDRVSLVAEQDGQVVGHVLFSDLPITTQHGTVTALALAPLAVLPACQCQGIGSALVRRGLALSRERGHRIVVVLGHPNFYPRIGFSSKLAERLESPYSGKPSFMATELVPGALEGVAGKVEYPPPFNDL
jgi:putative acetyltransferase